MLVITAVMTMLDPEEGTWAIIAIIVLGILSLRVLFGSRYQVGESELSVIFGPFSFQSLLEKLVLVRKGG